MTPVPLSAQRPTCPRFLFDSELSQLTSLVIDACPKVNHCPLHSSSLSFISIPLHHMNALWSFRWSLPQHMYNSLPHYMCTTPALHVHNSRITCAQLPHYMCTTPALNVHNSRIKCAQLPHYMRGPPPRCSLLVRAVQIKQNKETEQNRSLIS